MVIGHRGVNEGFTTGMLGSTAERSPQMSQAGLCFDRVFNSHRTPLLAYDGSQRASSAMESAAEFCAVLNCR